MQFGGSYSIIKIKHLFIFSFDKMKRFISHFLVFLVGFVAIITTLAVAVPYNANGYYLSELDKREMVKEKNRPESIILLGGSNVAFGFDSKLIADSLKKNVINGGVHAGLGIKYMIDDIPSYIRKGDILILSPEYDQFWDLMAYGELPLCAMFYIDGLRYPGKISSKQILAIIENTPRFVREKCEQSLFAAAGLSTDPTYLRSSFNSYGDACWHWYNERKHGFNGNVSTLLPIDGFNEDAFEYVVERLKSIQNKGIKVVLFPPAVEKESFGYMKRRVDYLSMRLSQKGFSFACSPIECAMDMSFFYDTKYHLNHEGAKEHSRALLHFLK